MVNSVTLSLWVSAESGPRVERRPRDGKPHALVAHSVVKTLLAYSRYLAGGTWSKTGSSLLPRHQASGRTSTGGLKTADAAWQCTET